jgi:hypothetical protein
MRKACSKEIYKDRFYSIDSNQNLNRPTDFSVNFSMTFYRNTFSSSGDEREGWIDRQDL